MALDSDRDADLTFDELACALAVFHPNQKTERKLAFAFLALDVNRDGLVDEVDLNIALRGITGSALSDAQLRAVCQFALRKHGVKQLRKDGKRRYVLDLEHFEAALADDIHDRMSVMF